jgi:plasmid stabilization system protein ParE
MSAKRARSLPVIVTDPALRDLDEIWEWNVGRYGLGHATRYLKSLLKYVDRLSTEYEMGQVVATKPKYRFRRLGDKSGGQGHLAVYRIDTEGVTVLRVYHTAQDWPSQLP